MREFLKLSATVLFVMSIVTIGIFISRSIFYIIEMRSFDLPFIDILKISAKAGSVGGLVGGLGIYLIPYQSKKYPRDSSDITNPGLMPGSLF